MSDFTDDPSDRFVRWDSLGEIRIPASLWRRIEHKLLLDRDHATWPGCKTHQLIRELLTEWVADIPPIPRYGPYTSQVVEIFERSHMATIRQVRRMAGAYTHDSPHLPNSDFASKVGLEEEYHNALQDGYCGCLPVWPYPARVIHPEDQTHANYVIGDAAAAVVLQDHLDPDVYAAIYGRWLTAMRGA